MLTLLGIVFVLMFFVSPELALTLLFLGIQLGLILFIPLVLISLIF
jgi:hypothetical protein